MSESAPGDRGAEPHLLSGIITWLFPLKSLGGVGLGRNSLLMLKTAQLRTIWIVVVLHGGVTLVVN